MTAGKRSYRGIHKCRYHGSDRKALQTLLRDKGFYSTEGRLRLLSLLKVAGKPLAVPSVARRLGGELDEVNVYRALEALSDASILTRSDVRRGGAHYEFAHTHHHHVVCRSCGRTDDVMGCDDKKLEARALKQSASFDSIATHTLEFFGSCVRCARRHV